MRLFVDRTVYLYANSQPRSTPLPLPQNRNYITPNNVYLHPTLTDREHWEAILRKHRANIVASEAEASHVIHSDPNPYVPPNEGTSHVAFVVVVVVVIVVVVVVVVVIIIVVVVVVDLCQY
jgi:hypothetical protein